VIGIGISGTTQADLRRLSRGLRQHGGAKALRRETVKALRESVKPVERDVKSAALSLPARGPRSTGLRRRIARATSTQVRLSGRSPGVKVRVSKARMGDQRNLPKLMNQGRWKKPVFGNRAVWAAQTSRPRWFDDPNRAARPMVRRRVKRVYDDIERKLDRLS